MRKVLLLSLVILACTYGTVQAPARPADQNAKQVDRIWKNPHPDQWRRSKWFEFYKDASIPAWVIISVGGYACVLETSVVDEPRRLDWFVCPTEWRHP